MSESTPESLHESIMDVYGDQRIASVEACGAWLLHIDKSLEPPLISLNSTDTGVAFTLDGTFILEGNPPAFFPDAQTEKDALIELAKLFGRI